MIKNDLNLNLIISNNCLNQLIECFVLDRLMFEVRHQSRFMLRWIASAKNTTVVPTIVLHKQHYSDLTIIWWTTTSPYIRQQCPPATHGCSFWSFLLIVSIPLLSNQILIVYNWIRSGATFESNSCANICVIID